MSYSIWYRGVLLGRSDLAARSPGPNVLAGQLDKAAEFDQVWQEIAPIVEEWLGAGMAMATVVAELPPMPEGTDPLEYGRQVHERFKDHPGAVRIRAASAALNSLGFELRDEADSPVAASSVIVQEVKFPIDIPREAIARHMEEARNEGYDVRFPSYIVTVVMPS